MEELEQRFRRAYWALVHYMDIARLRTWEERGLTLPQLRVLFRLRAQPGTTTNALARQLGLSTPTMSGLIDKLVRAGLVERGQRAEDRRVIPLRLTEEGTAMVGAIREDHRAPLATLAALLGPDLERVTEALEVVADGVERAQAHDGTEKEDPSSHSAAPHCGCELSP